MEYNFDKFTDRIGTNCEKYEFGKDFGKPDGLMPFWVADMDFPTAKPIVEAIKKRAEHGIFGYSLPYDSYYQAVIDWYEKYFDFKIKKEWIITTPGVVFALSAAIRGLTEVGDSVIIQTPVYYPFKGMIDLNGRKAIINQLEEKNGVYSINFDDFENKIIQNKVKLFILCSPHNPVGRVWKKQELEKLAEICKKNNVIVVSDEIHSDFVYEGYKHTVFQNIDGMEDLTITCTAPSKTFNLAGLQISNIIIKNSDIREKFKKAYDATGADEPNIFGIVACEAAYRNGSQWLDELKVYLKKNIEKTCEFLSKNMPKAKLIKPEGTYLLWIDFREYGLTEEELNDIIINKAGLWLNTGSKFGEGGEGFQRINIACPCEYLEKGLLRLAEAFK